MSAPPWYLKCPCIGRGDGREARNGSTKLSMAKNLSVKKNKYDPDAAPKRTILKGKKTEPNKLDSAS